MASEPQDDEYLEFLKRQQAAEQPRSVLDRPRPFTKPPKGSQKGALLVVLVVVATGVGLRVALWLTR